MHKALTGRKVAILIANGFDEIQMTDGQRALLAAGAHVRIVSTASGLVNGWHGKGWGHYYPVDQQVNETLAADFDSLYLPGGERSLMKLLETAHTLRIIRGFRDSGKPVAAIGSGVDLLIAADRISGAEISIGEASRDKAEAAGARITSESSVVDGSLLTAQNEAGLADFLLQMVSLFSDETAMQSAA